MFITIRRILVLIFFCCLYSTLDAQTNHSTFRVISFFTAKNDPAHISFVREANKWFLKMSDKHHFAYDTSQNWENLNKKFLSNYQVVIFLDTRPDSLNQRMAFQEYMEGGGAWMGF